MKSASFIKKQCASMAKITRPDASQVSFRPRLSQRLKESAKFPLTWVSGPPGSGKTSCVSSFVAAQEAPCLWYRIDSSDTSLSSFFHCLAMAYKKAAPMEEELPPLTPEYSLGIPEFSRNFFLQLISGLHNAFYLVLDNYQGIPDDIPLHELLLDVLNLMPENAHVIIISRDEPSAKFSRLGLHRKLNHIGRQELRFTLDEFKDVVAQWGFKDLPEGAIRAIHEKMDGWIAGLVFMLESTRKYNTSLQNIGTGAYDEIYHYFAAEIFEYQDSEVQHFLLKTSFLPVLTPKHGQAITGISRSCKILTSLHRHNLFVDRLGNSHGDAYVYHPLFREYLADRLADFYNGEEIVGLQRKTAAILFEDNLAEEAVDLLKNAQDWQGLIKVITDRAEILLAQGRSQLLQQWLASIPEEKLRENPWLSYWWASSLQHVNPLQAKVHYASAFETFCRQHDMAGAFSAWAGLVENITGAWHNFTDLDPLIDWLEHHYQSESQNLPGVLRSRLAIAMITALMIRRPGCASLHTWVENVAADAMVSTDVELAMQGCLAAANYHLWRGDQSNSWIILSRIRNLCRSQQMSPLSVLKSKCLEATMYSWFLSDGAKCLETVKAALEIARFTGVHAMDHGLYVAGAFGGLLARNYTLMGDYLQKIETFLDNSRQHRFFCHNYLSAWLSLLRGNTQRGIQHARQAGKTANATGFVYHEALALFAQMHILAEKGEFQEAGSRLEEFKKIIEPTASMLLQYMYLLTKAQFSIDLGKDEVGLKYLRLAMKLGREQGYQSVMCWWNPAAMTRLSMHALDNGIEADYVKDLVNRQGLVPAASPIEIEQWPWPLKIYTFGRFEIVKNGKAIRASGKAQQKPLAMLKAIIALGGRSVAEFHLAEALWPDADGDMQHQSLATTLHRLRRILGDKDMIDFNDGHISLNPRYCWVDAWAFERLLSQAEAESRKNESRSAFFAARYAEKAVELYKGNFLPQNSVDHWTIHMREKLKSRFLRGVSFLGRNLEKIEEREKAVTFYLQALETDPLVEEFYQRLMICYHRMDRNSDAVLVFRRCIKNFDRVLKISPSTQTKALYNNLLAKHFSFQQKDEPAVKKIKSVTNL